MIIDKPRILFCNIAYMKYYNIDIKTDKPQHGGAYVKDTGNAHEKINFHVYDDGNVYGFVETKHYGLYQNFEKANDLHIEKIDEKYKKSNEIPDVTVVFCAYSEAIRKTVIVGWYRNATVYRTRMFKDDIEYNISTTQSCAYLLDESERTYIVPRARDNEIGFGQSNLWYAEKPEAQKFVSEVLEYLSSKERENSCISKTAEIKRKISVNDKITYAKKEEYLKPLFGFKEIQIASLPRNGSLTVINDNSKFSSGWFLWSANENTNDSGCINVVSPDGTKITEITDTGYFYEDNPETNRYKDCTRVVFTKRKNNGPWCFRGVFIPDINESKFNGKKYENVFVRVATSIELIGFPTNKMRMLDLKLPVEVQKTEFDIIEEAEYIKEVDSTQVENEAVRSYVPTPQKALPSVIVNETEKYQRDPKQSKIALERAQCKCEFNENHESFTKISDGTIYTEPHHLIPVSQQKHFEYSLDVPANIVSLCSNCHNRIHYATLEEKKEILLKILQERKEQLDENGILINFKTLCEIYE